MHCEIGKAFDYKFTELEGILKLKMLLNSKSEKWEGLQNWEGISHTSKDFNQGNLKIERDSE